MEHLTATKIAEWEADTIIEYHGKEYGQWMDPRIYAVDLKLEEPTEEVKCTISELINECKECCAADCVVCADCCKMSCECVCDHCCLCDGPMEDCDCD